MFEYSFYGLLGVDRAATSAQIEAAYQDALAGLPRGRLGRALAWLNGRTPGTLAAARQVLMDPALRREYDRCIAQPCYLPPP
ncbi:hypothetical protein [Ramlibacter sp.]|uniref:hypothetical protein n=1 Tax=Ramlibacter sp. TaxID=1917967 RepID=UPI0017A0E28D|nr:hypothetical protein [Ramlibacter sp.]MBA2673962.1 hypothetical protein [Ramlibacter sp.]